jgi:hypothetical protein
MEYDFAIIYFGLTRSVKKTHESHRQHVFDVLKGANLTYKTFMHTWKTKDDTQNVWDMVVPQKIDYEEYKLLSPDFYTLDDENGFLESVNMDNYFYKHVWDTIGHSKSGEWLPKMVANHLCMLESQKRGFRMVRDCVVKGDKFKFVMFIRPDITLHNDLPVVAITAKHDMIHIPNHSHYEGTNDQFAIMNYEYADLYANRIDELAEFRKNHGRIVGEKYCKFIITKYGMKMNEIDLQYTITRP